MSTPVLPKLVGQRVKRREDPRLIQGLGTYVDDIKIVGMQHLAFKRSDVAHGRITSIDVSAAQAMDGVEAVFTGKQIAEFLGPMPIGTPFPSPEHRAVATDVVRFTGEPVAVVVAADRYLARDAADAIVVSYETLPAVDRHRAGDDRQAGADSQGLPQQPRAAARSRAAPASAPDGNPWTTRAIDKAFAARRGRDLAAHAEPSPGAVGDGAARRGRALRARQGHDDDLVVHAEPAHPADDDRGDERHGPGSGPRDRAGSGRRVRRQDQHLRRGVRRRGGLEEARPCR